MNKEHLKLLKVLVKVEESELNKALQNNQALKAQIEQLKSYIESKNNEAIQINEKIRRIASENLAYYSAHSVSMNNYIADIEREVADKQQILFDRVESSEKNQSGIKESNAKIKLYEKLHEEINKNSKKETIDKEYKQADNLIQNKRTMDYG